MTTNLWLFDSRQRPLPDSPRKLHIYPATPEGFEAAWALVVRLEVSDPQECDEYLDFGDGLFYHEGEGERVDQEEDALAFNQYWGCYGWYLMVVEDDQTIPHDITTLVRNFPCAAERGAISEDIMSNTFVFDLDGTLADLTHRLHFIENPTKDWRGFFAACGDDKLIEPVAELYRALLHSTPMRRPDGTRYHVNMVIVSGRSDECRRATIAWLAQHGLNYDALYMRKKGDHRPDHIVKAELLNRIIADGYRPIMIFDDRKGVVQMWREAGFTCAQVAPGDF